MLLSEALPGDRRTGMDGTLLGATIQALATNFQSLVLSRKNFTIEG